MKEGFPINQTKQAREASLWIELHPENLRHNIDEARKRIGKDVKLMAIMKGNAYGHGVSDLVGALNQSDIDRVGVYRSDEALALIEAGIMRPIQQLAYSTVDEMIMLMKYGVIPAVSCPEQIRRLIREKDAVPDGAAVHLRVDVSNGAIGIVPDELEEMVGILSRVPGLRVEGLFTHLPSNYSGSHEAVAEELKRFEGAVARIRDLMGPDAPTLLHAGSSPSLYGFDEAHYDMVRVGTWLYGLPSLESEPSPFLKPVMSVKSKIADIKTIGTDRRYLYGSVESYEEERKIAIVTVGYADVAYLFHYSGGEVLVNGNRVNVLGKPNMSHMTIDISGTSGISRGDTVTLVGREGDEQITFEDIAGYIGYSVVYCERLGLMNPAIRRVNT